MLVPRELDEMPHPLPLSAAGAARGELVRVAGTVASFRLFRQGRRSSLRVTIEDASGRLDALFFNQPWLRDVFQKGRDVELVGRVATTKSGPALTVPRVGHAEKQLPPPGHLEPVYPVIEGIGADFLRGLIAAAIDELGAAGTLIAERCPPDALGELGLVDLTRACRDLHAPPTRAAFFAAKRRLAFEKLFELAAELVRRRRARLAGEAERFAGLDLAELARLLPFEMTGAQARVLAELFDDLAKSQPMGRLLQGDVGSGKTAVATLAGLAVATHPGGGAQVAVMAPTEVLAEQHFESQAPLFEAAGVSVLLLTGSMSGAERKVVLARLAADEPLVVFGTHALFSKDVVFAHLALVIVDEEHRFGVEQRKKLAAKGRHCHRLSMTATPIPRSVARVLYGDMDLSVVDELPPGRGRVDTRWVRGAHIRRLPGFLRERLEAGESAFWVLPRIDASDPDDEATGRTRAGRGLEDVRTWMQASGLDVFGIEVVHGRLDAAERRRRFARFKAGEARLLVGTTVIEVGVDVPAATVIVIEDADRLGLAQLHQLRGRVGRGASECSWCFLLGPKSAAERFELLEATHDGFEIAEADAVLRGIGDLMGKRQSGLNQEGLEEFDARLFDAARRLVEQDDALYAAYLR
jgi:ATP-dependent DNA helicase RecG